MSTDTGTIDHLFLELSQFTKATTAKELQLQDAVRELCEALAPFAKWPGVKEALAKHAPKEETK
jgi:gamma-glutamyl:cysteine ligase YbdK (ATP-grasp superfamily)